MTDKAITKAEKLMTDPPPSDKCETVVTTKIPQDAARAFAELARKLETNPSDLLRRLVLRTVDGR